MNLKKVVLSVGIIILMLFNTVACSSNADEEIDSSKTKEVEEIKKEKVVTTAEEFHKAISDFEYVTYADEEYKGREIEIEGYIEPIYGYKGSSDYNIKSNEGLNGILFKENEELIVGQAMAIFSDSNEASKIDEIEMDIREDDLIKIKVIGKIKEINYQWKAIITDCKIVSLGKDEILDGQDSSDNTHEMTVSTEEAKLHFIDTGNSDAILIEQGGKFALIDGGDTDDDATVLNYLKNQGVSELEYLISTHPHADHIGGLDTVVNNFKVNKALVANGEATSKTYKQFIEAMANKGVYPSVPLLNSEFKLGTSTFKVLSVANTDDPNNNSIVLLYTNGDDKVLLMGDAEAEIEAKLNVGKVDLLKIGHHGSHSSSTPSFIDKVSPEYAVIQVGTGNKYGHPHRETMDTLKARGIKVHRNDECGDIVFTSTGNGLNVNCKEGSYNSPNGGYSSVSSTNKVENSTANTDKVVSEEPKIEDSATNSVGKVVYWTKNGKKYHLDPNCSNMNNPFSGTIEESGREACKKCA